MSKEPLPCVVLRRVTTCGECEYEEADGSLRWQCVTCALSDAFAARVQLLVESDSGALRFAR